MKALLAAAFLTVCGGWAAGAESRPQGRVRLLSLLSSPGLSAPVGRPFEGVSQEAARFRAPFRRLLAAARRSRALSRRGLSALRRAGYRDQMTGLYNGLYLEEHLGSLVKASAALLVFKLDFLKEINDALDHEAGDESLKALSAVAGEFLGRDAVLLRRSPTGFAAFLKDGPEAPEEVAEHLRAAVERKLGDRRFPGTISIGIAALGRGSSAQERYFLAFEAAEAARRAAKQAGGNQAAASRLEGATLLAARAFESRLKSASPHWRERLDRLDRESLGDIASHRSLRAGPDPASFLDRMRDGAARLALHAFVYRNRLTGLLNRRWFAENMGWLLGSGEFGHYLALDLDHFGALNDRLRRELGPRLGEQKGDEILSRVGKILAEGSADQALPVHLGGEEFIIMSRHSDPRGFAEEIRLAIKRALGVTVSIAVAPILDSQCGGSRAWGLTMVLAEVLLHRAKELGRDRVVEPGASPSKL
ncbi:MAG: GGDEF domain-containing protein [Elusimicrobia bacterium]|nr:GGDEF domain-containing protein [Elusimicrobiota bacterium]